MKLPRMSLLAGLKDGVNRDFVTALDFVPGTVVPFLNGQEVLSQAFAEVPPRTVRFEHPPLPTDEVAAYYVVL